jgi:cytochrome c553
MIKLYLALSSILFLHVYPLYSEDQSSLGRDIAENICSVCHGVNGQANSGGNSVLVPHLSGQNINYLIEKLKEYKSKKIEHHQMSLIADMLSIEDIKNVSSWYSSIKVIVEEID